MNWVLLTEVEDFFRRQEQTAIYFGVRTTSNRMIVRAPDIKSYYAVASGNVLPAGPAALQLASNSISSERTRNNTPPADLCKNATGHYGHRRRLLFCPMLGYSANTLRYHFHKQDNGVYSVTRSSSCSQQQWHCSSATDCMKKITLVQ